MRFRRVSLRTLSERKFSFKKKSFWCLRAKFSLGFFSMGEENCGGSTAGE